MGREPKRARQRGGWWANCPFGGVRGGVESADGIGPRGDEPGELPAGPGVDVRAGLIWCEWVWLTRGAGVLGVPEPAGGLPRCGRVVSAELSASHACVVHAAGPYTP